jgi:glycyl-tRNA synthetase (class II)
MGGTADHLKKLIEAPATDAATRKELEVVRKQIDDCNAAELHALLTKYQTRSPAGNTITEPFAFNLMFASDIGPHGNLKGCVTLPPASLCTCVLVVCMLCAPISLFVSLCKVSH